jgi:POT family proton-dependent oligopeptide transporter
LLPVHGSADDDRRQHALLWRGVAIAAVAALAIWGAGAAGLFELTAESLNRIAGAGLTMLTIGLFAWMLLAGNWSPVERRRIYVIAGLFRASTLFWSVFEQAGSTLNLFAARSTDNRIFGWEFPPSWFQSVNGLFIVLFAPVFAWIWLRMGARDPSSPAKFSLALIQVGLGFVTLVGGAMLAAGGTKVSPMWLIVTYLLHTWGELCLSPVGLSAFTKLAPARVAGFMMGVWFLSISLGNYLGGRMASLYEALPLTQLLAAVGGFAIVAGLILAVFTKPMVRLMGGAK